MRFFVVVPQTAAAPRQRDLRRGRARLRAGARRPGARVHARRGHRRARARSATPTRSTPPWTRSRAHADRRDHRLHAARDGLGLAAARPDRAPRGGDRAAGRARRRRPRRPRACRSTSRSCVANQTVAGAELVERLKALADEGPRRFIVVVPQSSARRAARCARRASGCGGCSRRCDDAGIVAAGMIGDPDPYTAVMNAVQYFHISEIVISTLPEGTLAVGRRQARRARARARRNVPVEHIESARGARRPEWPRTPHRRHAATTSTSTTGRPRPTAPRASTPPLLGMLLFIISEIMIFGAFFTAYFFIRVVNGDAVAGRGHRAAEARSPASTPASWSRRRSRSTGRQECAQEGQPPRAARPAWSPPSCSALTFLFIQINEYVHIGFAPQDTRAGRRSSTGSPACTARTCRSA